MHQRKRRGHFRAALAIVTIALAATAATAQAYPSPTLPPGNTVGVTSCSQLSGLTFQQSDYCFYFPNGETDTSALCTNDFCGQVDFLLPQSGTFTATLTYPSPNGFNLLALQLCHDGQAAPNPATCSQTMAPGGADVPGCTMDTTPGDNGTPGDLTDDTMTTTLTCPIPVGDSVNPDTLIVYPLSVLNCTDPGDMVCAADFMHGVTAALQATFSSTLTSPGPEGAKASGGGEVAPRQHFALHAVNDPSKASKTLVRFAIASNDTTRCMFASNGATYVDIEPNPFGGGGTAYITGTGTVTDSLKVKHPVTYQLQVADMDKNGPDTFQLTAQGCDTAGAPVPVSHGNIVIRPEKGH
jgi:hypothetical protein